MRKLVFSLALILGSCCTANAQEQDWGHTPDEFVPDVFRRLDAVVVDCPSAALGEFGRGDTVRCARLQLTARQFTKLWRKTIHKGGGPAMELEAVTAWEGGKNFVRRYYRSDIIPIAVIFDAAKQLLIVSRGDLIYCDSDEWRVASEGIRDCGDLKECEDRDGFSCPALTRSGGRYPWFGPTSTSSVDIKAIILKDGAVGRICIDKTKNKRFNMIFPYVITVRRRLYDPATDSGVPIPVIFKEEHWIKTGY